MSPFVQVGEEAKTKGTGLGLAICKQLAAGMGGSLSFVSELDKGTTFTLELRDVKSAKSLPNAEAMAAKHDEARSGKTSEGQKDSKEYHILIADDVPLNLAVLKALLKKVGVHDVETAVDGQDAWEKIQASERPFDLVLTDMWMPKMNGPCLENPWG